MRTRRAVTLAASLAVPLLLPMGVTAQDELPASLGANTPALQDDLSVPGTWGLPDAHGSTTDTDGELRMTFSEPGWMWGWQELPATHHPVLRVEGPVAIEGVAAGGFMCGTTSDAYAFAVIDGDDGWWIGHVVDDEVSVDAQGSLPASMAGVDGEPRTVSVECGQENVDITRVLLRVEGTSIASRAVPPIGPFGRVAFVGHAESAGPSVDILDIAAWTGTRYTPSADAGSTPGPVASLPVVESALGADTVAFQDDFTTPDLWGTGASEAGIVSYADDQLAITILSRDATRWTWRSLDRAAPVLRIEGLVSVNGEGGAGWMCGDDSQSGDFLFGVMGASGSYTVGQLDDGAVSVLDQGTVAAGAPGTEARQVVLECGDTEGGDSRVLLWIGGEQVADVTVDGTHGPYRRVTALAGSASDTVFNARFDDVMASMGASPAPDPE